MGIVIAEHQSAEKRPRAFGIGPADHHEFLAVQAFDLEPQPAVAKRVGRIGTFRHDALASRTLAYEIPGRCRSGDRSRAGVKSNGVIVAADRRYGSRTRDLYRQHPKR